MGMTALGDDQVQGGPSMHCRACKADVVPFRTRLVWKAAFVGGCVTLLATTAGIILSGTALLGTGLILFGLGHGMMGPLHEKAFEDPHCPTCGRAILPPSKFERAEKSGAASSKKAKAAA
jgi:hypothetical protein